MPNVLDAQWEKVPLASTIADKWVTWGANRATWLAEKKELRQYLFATSTRDTTNEQLPWKNSTVTPKLTQIRDNLHANYIAALFPNDKWFKWQAGDNDSTSKQKRDTIEAYMRTKLQASDFDVVVSQLVLDYIDYGNVFAGHEYVCKKKIDPVTNQEEIVYAGPRAFRISPLDVAFDPTAASFNDSPCIVRRLKSLGELREDVRLKPWLGYDSAIVEKLQAVRLASPDTIDALKSDGLAIDGFGTIEQYFSTGMVELLDFYGDIYDVTSRTYHTDVVATVADRRWILRMEPNKSWTGSRPIKHCGWRLRPDNIWAQGPLDQLVGMQYRIDHLENLKADVFDQIAHPITVFTGLEIDDFEFGPGAKIYLGEGATVEFKRPEAGALSADMEIQTLMDRMEELAGAPRQAAGIRTPGEKTKYEVQVLENGAGRIFQSKVNWFEKNVVEPLLNSMLEEAIRNMGAVDTIKVVDPDYGTEKFTQIRKEDIIAKGKFFAIGARHFAEQAIFVQELTQTLQLVEQLPTVKPHISGEAVAKALEETMGWKMFNIVKKNVMLDEQADTQRHANQIQETLEAEAGMPSEPQEGDVPRNMPMEPGMMEEESA